MERENAQPLLSADDDQTTAAGAAAGQEAIAAKSSPAGLPVETVETAETAETAQGPVPDQQPHDLPASYNGPSITLLPVEPHLAHAYWEFAFRPQSAAASHGTGIPGQVNDERPVTRPVLRLYEVTGAGDENAGNAGFFDVEVELAAGSRYIQLAHPDRSYLAELGFKAGSGHFFPAVRSNVIIAPRAEPLPAEDQDQPPPSVSGTAAGPEQMPAAPAGLALEPLRPVDCWLPPGLAATIAGHSTFQAGQAKGACPQCSIPGQSSISTLGPAPGQMSLPSPEADAEGSGKSLLAMDEGRAFPPSVSQAVSRHNLPWSCPDLTALSEQAFVCGISSK